jgi:hypothetical protein
MISFGVTETRTGLRGSLWRCGGGFKAKWKGFGCGERVGRNGMKTRL